MSGYGDERRAMQCSFCPLETLLLMSRLCLPSVRHASHSKEYAAFWVYGDKKMRGTKCLECFGHFFYVKIFLELHNGTVWQIVRGLVRGHQIWTYEMQIWCCCMAYETNGMNWEWDLFNCFSNYCILVNVDRIDFALNHNSM